MNLTRSRLGSNDSSGHSHRARRCLAGAMLAALTFAGCAVAPLRIVPVNPPAAGSDPAAVVSQKASRVTLRIQSARLSEETAQLPTLLLAVTNGSPAPVPFSLHAVRVFSGDKPVRIYTADELMDRIRTEVQQEYSSAAAQQAASRTATSPLTDATAAAIMARQANAVHDAAASNVIAERQVAAVKDLLTATTLEPGKTARGLIKLHAEDISRTQPLRIVVTVGDESHEFTCSLTP